VCHLCSLVACKTTDCDLGQISLWPPSSRYP
jgi:hypothetical protein